MKPEKTIEINRAKIDRITGEMIRLIHRRDLAVKKITRAKKALGMTMLDRKREAQLIKKVRAMAMRAGVDQQVAEDVTMILVSHSRGLL